jgi:hypothetical protein
MVVECCGNNSGLNRKTALVGIRLLATQSIMAGGAACQAEVNSTPYCVALMESYRGSTVKERKITVGGAN